MSFHERILPPIITSSSLQRNISTTVLPSSLKPPITPIISTINPLFDTTKPQNFNFSQSQQSYMIQSIPSSKIPFSPQKQLPHPPSHYPNYHQTNPIDLASELLAEKRRRNASASARFRDRRRQREKEIQEKCQSLERKVQELESSDYITELKKKLDTINNEKDALNKAVQVQYKEVITGNNIKTCHVSIY
jgi:DNA repair exonuclease SbcCD ATPase subunit